MKRFLVQLEDHGFAFSVDVKAETIEDAVKIARERHCEPRQVTVTPRPTWVEPYRDDMEEGEEIYELSHEIQGECSECGLVFLSNHQPDPSWPWVYASGDDRGNTNICYACAQKRKEKGDYCPLFQNFFRGPSCEECPANECPNAQNRYYKEVARLLTDALSVISRETFVPEVDEIRTFIEHNELGLAYDALKQRTGDGSLPVSHTDGHASDLLTAAKSMMEKGWK